MNADTERLAATVGARITAYRKERGWSLSSLAARAGIGKATLSEIEAGTRNPTLETLYAIAAQLGLPLARLLTDPGRPPEPSPAIRGDAVSGTLLEVFDDPGVTTELYRLVIRAGARQTSPGHGPGVTEYLSVTSGTALVGPVDAPFEIAAGAHGSWESAGEHTYAAVGGDAEAILLIRYPRPPAGA
jgi:XRE family transcriptional regulator, regulator of sulfur utilization